MLVLAFNDVHQNADDQESSPLIDTVETTILQVNDSGEKEAVSFFAALRIPVSSRKQFYL